MSELCGYLATLEALPKPGKYDQDALDAWLCLMAGLDDAAGDTMTVGQPDSGFIVVPYGEAAYKKLEARCVATGRDPDTCL